MAAHAELPPPPPAPRSRAGYVFGGLAFIPGLGVFFAIVAIVIGAIKRDKNPALLGAAGIAMSVVLYGGLFYFGFVAKTGIYAEMKIKLASQAMMGTAGQIALYKLRNGHLPETLREIDTERDKYVMTFDPWFKPLVYKPNADGTFELRSAGPDGEFDTEDDIVQTY